MKFAIMLNQNNHEETFIKLAEDFKKCGHLFFDLSDVTKAIQEIQINQCSHVFVVGENTNFPADLIIQASVNKILHNTTFYYLTNEELCEENQIKLMTIGYENFLRSNGCFESLIKTLFEIEMEKEKSAS